MTPPCRIDHTSCLSELDPTIAPADPSVNIFLEISFENVALPKGLSYLITIFHMLNSPQRRGLWRTISEFKIDNLDWTNKAATLVTIIGHHSRRDMPAMANTSPINLLPTHRLCVPAEWIDANGHMNAAFYTVAIKDAAILAHDIWDYGSNFRETHGQSNFVIDARVRYLRELRCGVPLRISARILSVEDKRAWNLYEIWNEQDESLAALVAYHLLHVHLGPPPRAGAIPPDLRQKLAEERQQHETVPMLGVVRDFVTSLQIESYRAMQIGTT